MVQIDSRIDDSYYRLGDCGARNNTFRINSVDSCGNCLATATSRISAMARPMVSRRDTPVGNDIIHARIATKPVDLQFGQPGRKAAGCNPVDMKRDCGMISGNLRRVKTAICHNYKLAGDYRLNAVSLGSANFGRG